MPDAPSPFWIQTHTPQTRFDLANPRAEDVRIEDIAYSLSRLCRFTGHCNRFYSVAQHSIHVAEIVAEAHPEWALAALLHDAEEAYIGDISSPLKALIENRGGRLLLHGLSAPIRKAIALRFGLYAQQSTGDQWHAAKLADAMHAAIKAADLKMLATERRDLMPVPPADGADWYASTGVPGVEPCTSHVPDSRFWKYTNEEAFLLRFEQYGGKR